MATVHNCLSFETGGLEEADVSTQGAPEIGTTSPTPKHGTYRLGLIGSTTTDQFIFNVKPDGSDLDNNTFLNIGMYIQFNDVTPVDVQPYLIEVQTSAGTLIGSLELTSGGDMEIRDANGTLQATATTPFTVDTWHLLEWVVEITATGLTELFIDGDSVASDPSGDYDAGGNEVGRIRLKGNSAASDNMYIDSLYIQDQATEPTILGDFEVRAYGPAGGTGFTTTGTAPALGAWADTDEIPFNNANKAEWQGTSDTFSAVADGSINSGPSGDSGIGTIHGAKFITTWRRDGGAGSTHFMRFGNDVDTPLGETADLGLTTGYLGYIVFSTAAGVVPLATENFEFGGRISGAQDMKLGDQIATLLFSPAAAGNPVWFYNKKRRV